ncbi:TetR/AcrR family transcriptional regulator [Rhodococcus sp. BP-349]|uniref:TetR/AcrR family transcriptional regulator n=1 Tax=unclassified Rhodococcus (in: high G+C Gram-positive bacteria) TaxID=192944 RepID=UPI001C9B1632|nr:MULTISPECIES: TetR/AcrR family transcriptional regulator [unclassified Rhodococcus (in: high G+C Gram-positive bacteria)]MBY6537221.1 TetR/AcrR family transcriptional regulator [Rhodococcus sp. BP-363]MBY6541558.1 TetR/AcrR family transcriptional regulator [Rhodococcus sp. BP-369]MBY6560788.1 TetR/AcrR family transcriptional regulator [Rhodococcus sp. BP-370]MBY6575080.1 TetR/AcrR family transcriptional regulator [Rhodococcus sp. BP-364]MBY6584381.1 TetR/AcrR family transcriptional regulato
MASPHSSRDGNVDDEPVRDRLVRSAVELLADAGPSELKVRTITDRAGVSTITVYHHFGGLQELLREVVIRGYADLRAALLTASKARMNPGARLFAMALTTRDVAQNNAHLYDMMFGLSTRGTYRYVASSDRTSSEGFAPAYAVLTATCEELARTGVSPIDGEQIAAELWSLVHGFVTLEISGNFAGHADPVATILQPMAVNHFVGMGYPRDLSVAGAAKAMAWWKRRR